MTVDNAADAFSQELELVKGDANEWTSTVTEPDPASTDEPPSRLAIRLDQAVDGTANRYAIIRFAAKLRPEIDSNQEALLFKESYRDDEIKIEDQSVDATKGVVVVYADPEDTYDVDHPTADDDEEAQHAWDLEVNVQDFARSGAAVGTVTVTNGSKTVSGVGTAFQKAKLYDIINVTDVDNLQKPALITEIVSDTEIKVSRDDWATSAGATFEVRRNRRRTIAGGPFKLKTGVVDP